MKRFAPLLCLAIAASPVSAQEQPTGGTVASGSASISRNAKTTTIDQTTDKAVINWESFNVGAGATTRFNQPGANSITLNRTLQNDPSRIDGRIEANGNIMLLNPHGVLFGPSSRVDVNGLMVSTGTMEDEDFRDGRYEVEAVAANPDAAIINRGEITLKEGGWAALVAPRVENAGIINAPLGRVALGSGEAFTLDLRGDGLIKFRAPLTRAPGGGAALVTNTGTIAVEGGTVNLDARAVEGLVESVVNVDGVIRTSSARVEGGKVILSGGDHGVVEVRGDIAARSERAGDEGGRVVVTGELIDVKAQASIDASGHSGGGDIEIGGDLQGEQTVALGEIRRNAEAVRIEDGATIKADALDVGDGGRIIVWADRWTAAAADLSARGGINAGNGGFIEVSGKEHLVWRGFADLRAPAGDNGTLLLDPTNITIVADPTPSSDIDPLPLPVGGPFPVSITGTATATNSVINITDLQNQLLAGDVIITTATGVGPTGNITVDAPITYGGAGGALTLTADNAITVNQAITTSGGPLDLTMNAGDAIAINAQIDTNGGQVDFNAETGVTVAGVIRTDGGDLAIDGDRSDLDTGAVTINADVDSDGGLFLIESGLDLTIGGGVTVTGGGATMTLTADANGGGTGIIAINGTVDAGASALTLTGANFALGLGASIKGGGTVRVQPSQNGTTVGIAGGAGAFGIGATELDAFVDGFSQIILGRETSTALLTLGDYTFDDPVRLVGEGVTVDTALNTNDDSAVTLDAIGGAVNVDGGIDAGAGDVAMTGANFEIMANVVSSGTVTVEQPANTDMTIGALGSVLENDELVFLDDGEGELVLGNDAAGTQNLVANGVTHVFGEALTLLAGDGGEIQTNGLNAGTNDVTLRGGDFEIMGVVQTSGAVTVEQAAGVDFFVGGPGPGAQLDNTELDNLDDGAVLRLGNAAATGDMTVDPTHTFGSRVVLRGGQAASDFTVNSPIRTTGRAVAITSGGATLTPGGALTIDTTNAGGNAGGANILIVAPVDGGGADMTLDGGNGGTVAMTGAITNVGRATLTGANITANDLNAADVRVTNGSGAAELIGTVGGAGGSAAAIAARFPADSTDFTFNGFTASGESAAVINATAETPVGLIGNPDAERVVIGSGGGTWGGRGDNGIGGGGPRVNRIGNREDSTGGGFGGGGGAVSSGLLDAPGDVMFAELEDADFLALRTINEEASATDSALLAGERGGLVGEILSALDRNQLTEDGAPAGPYGERTALIPGVLVYDPNAGVQEEEIDPFRPPVFGALEGW